MFQHLTIFLILILCSAVHSQEYMHEHHNRLGFVVAGTFIPSASSNEGCENCSNKQEGIVVPTIGVEYIRLLSDVGGFGGMVELELDHYIILNKELNRHNALIIVAFAMYKILPQWFLIAGGGIELEEHKNLGVLRLATGYEIHLGNGWDISPLFTFDHKMDLNSFALGVSIGKVF